MESTPRKTILQMRQSLDEMDISPAKKAEAAILLDKIEKKDGIAPQELKTLSKLLANEERQISQMIALAKSARKKTDEFVKKTDRIFAGYLSKLKKI